MYVQGAMLLSTLVVRDLGCVASTCAGCTLSMLLRVWFLPVECVTFECLIVQRDGEILRVDGEGISM